MSPTLLDAILDAQGLPREAQEAPNFSKMEPKTRKNACRKTSRFYIRFFHGLDVIFDGFLYDFLKQKRAQTTKSETAAKAIKHWPWRQNQGSALTTINQNRLKKTAKFATFLAHRF